MGDKGGG